MQQHHQKHQEQTIADLEEVLKRKDLIEAELNDPSTGAAVSDDSASTSSTNTSISSSSSSTNTSSNENQSNMSTAVCAALHHFNSLWSFGAQGGCTQSTMGGEGNNSDFGLMHRLSPFIVINEEIANKSVEDEHTAANVALAAVNSVVNTSTSNKPIGFERQGTATPVTTNGVKSSPQSSFTTGLVLNNNCASATNVSNSAADTIKMVSFSDILTDQMLNLDIADASLPCNIKIINYLIILFHNYII